MALEGLAFRQEGGEVSRAVAATSRRTELQVERRVLNGQPALVFHKDDQPFAAVLLVVAEGRIQRVFFQADPRRLRHLGRRAPRASQSGSRRRTDITSR
jgi:RNA polymerase sigma-70 factor, ECF subfamily